MNEQNNLPLNKPAQNSKKIWTIIIVVLVIFLFIGSGVYAWQKFNPKSIDKNLRQQITDSENQMREFQQTVNSASEPTKQADEVDTTATNNDTNEKKTIINMPLLVKNSINNLSGEVSSLSSIDQTWNLYTNNKYGFSIKVPKKMYHGYGSMCAWKIDSYRPIGGLVPVKIFEDNSIYISSEYFYQLTGETMRNNHYYYSGCEKITNTIPNLEDDTYFQQLSWKFVVKNVKNDNELDTFIKSQYGNGCKIGAKNSSAQEGVYDVTVQGDLGGLAGNKCEMNYITVLKYYPTKNEVVSWNLGQAPTFVVDASQQTAYDLEMVKSFKFIVAQ